jgi:hypothetical protein
MKKTCALFVLSIQLISVSVPAIAAPAPATRVETRVNELSNRFNSLEATWGRFQIGGNVFLEAKTDLDPDSDELPIFGFGQELGLFLDARIDQHFGFSLKMTQDGGWGLKQTDYSGAGPLSVPPQVDEVFLKMEYPHTLNYLGRFRYSLGPFGLVSDFFTEPAEGIVLQRSFKDYHVAGLYSRYYTQTSADTGAIEMVDNYFAARLGWSNRSSVVGINIVPDGLSGQKLFGADYSTTFRNGRFAAEVGWYSFHNNDYPEEETGWSPGILASYSRQIGKSAYFQVKGGYLSRDFKPTHSSLYHAPDDNREWFVINSQGLEFTLQNPLPYYGLLMENRLLALQRVNDADAEGTIYRLRSAVVKNISPVNQLQFGVDLTHSQMVAENNLFLSWNLQF